MNSALLGTIIAAAAGVVGSVLVYRNQRRSATTDAAQRQIDQIQEDREADRSSFRNTVERMEQRQQRLEQRLESAESLFRLASDYILALRYHIAEGKQPPPPPFPPQLTQGMTGDR